MATYLTAATKESLATQFGTLGTYISLHTGDPGTAGTANEASGGSYARVQTTWSGGASDGIITGSAVDINAPVNTYTYIGVWSAATGGTFVGSSTIASTAISGSAGIVRVTPTFTVS